MELTDSIAVSASALDAQRRRLNVIASNLANAHSTHSLHGGPYRRRDVVFQAVPFSRPFQRAMRHAIAGRTARELVGVRVARVVENPKPGPTIYDPRHPDANDKGFVTLPNVNVLEEMVNLIGASRAYEANVQAINATRSMWNRALEIGR